MKYYRISLIILFLLLFISPSQIIGEEDKVYTGEMDINGEEFSELVESLAVGDEVTMEWKGNGSTDGYISCGTGPSKSVDADEVGRLQTTATDSTCLLGIYSLEDENTTVHIEYAYNWNGDVDLGNENGEASFPLSYLFALIPIILLKRQST